MLAAPMCVSSAWGQITGRRADDASKRAQKWAVLVGIDQYDDVTLRYCTEDATAVVGGLIASGFNEQQVYALTDNVVDVGRQNMSPTKENLEKAMDLVLSLPEKDDLMVVGFFGVGVQILGDDGRWTAYLCPKGGRLSDVKTLIPLSDLCSRMVQCPARYKILILDVNRESMHQSPLPEGVQELDLSKVDRPFGVQILAASSAGEVSCEDEGSSHGVFANFLLTGIKDPSSGADWNNDGDVSIQELYSYVKVRTKAFVARNFFRRQQVTLYGETSSDFVVCTPTAIRQVGRDQRVLPLGSSLQTAINRALPNSRIIVASGVCQLPRTVVVDRPVEIVGEGADATVFTCASGPVFDVRSKGVVIRELGVKGLGSRGENSDDFDSAICVRNSDLRVIGCRISSEVRNGVYAVSGLSQPVLVRCTLVGCRNSGVRASGGSLVTVRECLLTENSESGVSVAPFTKAIVQNCVISRCDVGLDVDRMGNVDFAQIDFQRNGEDAIRVANTPVIGLSGRGENALSVVHFKNMTGPYEDAMTAGSHNLAPISSAAYSATAGIRSMNVAGTDSRLWSDRNSTGSSASMPSLPVASMNQNRGMIRGAASPMGMSGGGSTGAIRANADVFGADTSGMLRSNVNSNGRQSPGTNSKGNSQNIGDANEQIGSGAGRRSIGTRSAPVWVSEAGIIENLARM